MNRVDCWFYFIISGCVYQCVCVSLHLVCNSGNGQWTLLLSVHYPALILLFVLSITLVWLASDMCCTAMSTCRSRRKWGRGGFRSIITALCFCVFLARKGRKENSLYIGGRTFFCHSIPPGGRFRLWVVWKPSPFFTAIDTNGHTPAKNMCRPLDGRWRGVFACHWIQPVATWLSGIATLVRRVSAHLHSLAFVCKRVARTFVKRPATTTFHEFNLSWFVHLLLQSSVWQTGSGQRSNVG